MSGSAPPNNRSEISSAKLQGQSFVSNPGRQIKLHVPSVPREVHRGSHWVRHTGCVVRRYVRHCALRRLRRLHLLTERTARFSFKQDGVHAGAIKPERSQNKNTDQR